MILLPIRPDATPYEDCDIIRRWEQRERESAELEEWVVKIKQAVAEGAPESEVKALQQAAVKWLEDAETL